MATKQFNEKVVVSDKLAAGMVKVKTITPEVIVSDDVSVDGSATSDLVTPDVGSFDQPLLMAKADIETVGAESASGAIISDADVTYTDHISSDVAEVATEQPELVAMNTVQHLTDSTVQVAEVGAAAAVSSSVPWLAIGAGAAAGGGILLAGGSHDTVAPVADTTPAVQDIHVVVARDGAFIDTDNDGVRDDSELTAIFGSDGDNVGLADHSVLIHFDDAPLDAIDLTGFRADDKIEFDVQTMYNGNVFCESSNFVSKLASTASHIVYGFSCDVSFIVNQHTSNVTDFNHNLHSGVYAMSVHAENSFNGTDYGAIAYWSDSGNALNDHNLVLPEPPVMVNLLSGEGGGVVEFVTMYNQDSVVVNDHVIVDAGGAFMDTNGNGIHDNSETTAAVFSSGGNADLAANAITIHFHDAPDVPIDLTGFTSDDQIEIDMNAFYWGDKLGWRTKQSSVSTTVTSINGNSAIIADHNNWWNATASTSVHGFVGTISSNKLVIGQVTSSSSNSIISSNVVANFGAYNPVDGGNVDFVQSYNYN